MMCYEVTKLILERILYLTKIYKKPIENLHFLFLRVSFLGTFEAIVKMNFQFMVLTIFKTYIKGW